MTEKKLKGDSIFAKLSSIDIKPKIKQKQKLSNVFEKILVFHTSSKLS